jgi:hypothetical protein
LAYRSPSKPEPVVPVTDPAELIQLFARLIENASDAVAVERAVAGAVRLASLPLADRAWLAGPLMKRAEQVAGGFGWSGFTGGEIRADLSRLVHVWATGQRPTIRPKSTRWPDNHPYKHPDKVSDSRQALMMSAIITARVFEACELVASGRPVTLLAEPEFADGTIGHSALLDRLASSPLFGWRLLVTDLTNQTQTHLAHRERADSHWRSLGAIYTQLERTDEVVAAWPLLAPHHPELIAAHLLLPLSDGLDAGRSGATAITTTAATTALNGLAQPGHEFGKMGHLALIAAMASGESDTRIAAAPTWTRTAQDGRLTPDLAADAITQGVASNAFKLNRIAESLGYVATDPVAAASVAQAAMLATAALLPVKPTNLHLLLEQSARAAATGLAKTASTSTTNSGPSANAIPPAIAALAASSTRTKLAEAARLLTQVA